MSEQNKALVRELLAAIDGQDLDRVAACLSADATTLIAGQPGAMDPRGFRQFGEMFNQAVPDGHHTIVQQLADGDTVVTRVVYEGTHLGNLMGVPPSAKKVSIGGVWIDRIAGDKIVERYVIFDTLTMMQQVGAIPAPGQTTA